VRNEKKTRQLRSKILKEMQIYLGKIRDLNVQNSKPNTGPHGAKLNYFHGRFEGLQWVLTNMYDE